MPRKPRPPQPENTTWKSCNACGATGAAYDHFAKRDFDCFYCNGTGGNWKGKDVCFVATAIYGSYDAPQVLVLRNYRDNYLKNKLWGRGFITLYYKIGPLLAMLIQRQSTLRKFSRLILDNLVKKLSKK